MKKETYHLCIRLIAGVAAALILVGCTAIAGEKLNEGRSGILYQASGIPLTKKVMTVEGQAVLAEEYLYYTWYNCQMVASAGFADMTADIGEGVSVADFVKEQAKSLATGRAVIDAWAIEKDLDLTEEELAEIEGQLDTMDFAAMYVSRDFVKKQLSNQYRTDKVLAAYTQEGGAFYPTEEEIKDAMAAGNDHGHEHDEATVVAELCDAEYAVRWENAEVIVDEELLATLDLAAFFEKMVAFMTAAQ